MKVSQTYDWIEPGSSLINTRSQFMPEWGRSRQWMYCAQLSILSCKLMKYPIQHIARKEGPMPQVFFNPQYQDPPLNGVEWPQGPFLLSLSQFWREGPEGQMKNSKQTPPSSLPLMLPRQHPNWMEKVLFLTKTGWYDLYKFHLKPAICWGNPPCTYLKLFKKCYEGYRHSEAWFRAVIRLITRVSHLSVTDNTGPAWHAMQTVATRAGKGGNTHLIHPIHSLKGTVSFSHGWHCLGFEGKMYFLFGF